MANSVEDHLHTGDNFSDSDSDTTAADYILISAAEDSDSDSIPNPTFVHANGGVVTSDLNPSACFAAMSIFDLQNGGLDSDEDEEEESEREAEIERAFVEDERRRSARLTAENAARVMEAMRGVSFAGAPPPWAGEVGEDLWASQLRRLRERRG